MKKTLFCLIVLLNIYSLQLPAEEKSIQEQIDEVKAMIEQEQTKNAELKAELASKETEVSELKLKLREIEDKIEALKKEHNLT